MPYWTMSRIRFTLVIYSAGIRTLTISPWKKQTQVYRSCVCFSCFKAGLGASLPMPRSCPREDTGESSRIARLIIPYRSPSSSGGQKYVCRHTHAWEFLLILTFLCWVFYVVSVFWRADIAGVCCATTGNNLHEKRAPPVDDVAPGWKIITCICQPSITWLYAVEVSPIFCWKERWV